MSWIVWKYEICFTKDRQRSVIVTPMIFTDYAEGMLALAMMSCDFDTIFIR